MNEKEKILFVDDDESILDIASEYFQYKGYHIITATNGHEAVKILENEKIDCCFTDINMPEMDGLEATKQIRNFERCSDIPIIAVSSLASQKEIEQGLAVGVSIYITKPFNDEELLAHVQSYIG